MPWEKFRTYYEDEKLADRREATRKKAGYVFDKFEELTSAILTLGQITGRTISKYTQALREAGMQPATIQRHLAYLRAALHWASKQRFIREVPTFIMPKLPKKKTIRKIVAEQFEKLLAKAKDPHWKRLITTAWYTGMRWNEMLDLTWDNREMPWIDFATSRIRIPAAYNKSDEDQIIPLHADLAKDLKEVKDRTGFLFPFRNAPREVSRKFTKLARSAGLKITLHDLRRSFGSRYAAVVPAQVLQRLMRHSSIETTLRYYTDIDDVLDDAIKKA
jgi:integrase